MKYFSPLDHRTPVVVHSHPSSAALRSRSIMLKRDVVSQVHRRELLAAIPLVTLAAPASSAPSKEYTISVPDGWIVKGLF